MKADYINPFISATKNVLNQFISDIEFNHGEVKLENSQFSTTGVAAIVGISGDLEGRVILDMNIKTAKRIAGQMDGEQFEDLNEMAKACIQELANMMSGKATTTFRNKNNKLTINISPPSLLVGKDATIRDSVNTKLIKVPLKTNYGNLLINLGVKENK